MDNRFILFLGFDYSAGFRNAKGGFTLNQSYVTDSFFKLFEISLLLKEIYRKQIKNKEGESIVVNRAALHWPLLEATHNCKKGGYYE